MSEHTETTTTSTASGGVDKLGQSRLGSVCSTESFEANLGEDSQAGALVGFLERLDPAIAHRNSVLRKPGTNRSIYVDEIDEECVSMKCIPRGLIRGRSVGVVDRHGEDLMTQAQLRTASEKERALFGSDDFDEDKEFTSYELARRICPEGFHRFRRVGAVPMQFEEPKVGKDCAEVGTKTDLDVDADDVADGEEGYEYEYEYEYESGDEDWYEQYAGDGQASEVEQSAKEEQSAEEEEDEDEDTGNKLERQWSDEVFDVEVKFGKGADRVERLHNKIKGYGYRGYGTYDGLNSSEAAGWFTRVRKRRVESHVEYMSVKSKMYMLSNICVRQRGMYY
ncbi:transmembrane protein [Gracilaria domingensis]|nr:transmembrane protein [Gracilaria domingensis]